MLPFGIVLTMLLRLLLIAFPWKSLLTVDIIEPYPHTRIERRTVKNNKIQIQSSSLTRFSPSRILATLRNKRKLAAVSRETPNGSRGGRGRNVLDPELTQVYISQVSEEIEGRVTKKLSKEFNKTESRILGALSKLDEFLLNPQVRTCSVAAHGTSRNSNLENRETHEDRSSNGPYPEGGIFLSTQDNSIVLRQTWWRKPILTAAYLQILQTKSSNGKNIPLPQENQYSAWKQTINFVFIYVLPFE